MDFERLLETYGGQNSAQHRAWFGVGQGLASTFGIGPKKLKLPLDGGPEHHLIRSFKKLMKNATRIACDRLLQCLL